jgi:hypothetical protein
MTFGASGRERQHWVQAIERLNRGLFIRGEDGRVLWRITYNPITSAALTSKWGSSDGM